MADGIRDKVAIIGMGCTKFGELWDKSIEDLMVEAFTEAITDAGIEKKDIQAAWQGGPTITEISTGHSAMPLSTTLKLPFIPTTKVENMCATGSEALRAAAYAVAAGACDIALALGAEKLKDTGYPGLPEFSQVVMIGTKLRIIMANNTTPGMFAIMATRYFSQYGLSPEQGKETLAKISAKSHHNGSMCEKAHLRREVTCEQVINAPMVAWPLGLFDCCGVSDGAAAAIVTRADMAKNFRKDPVYLKASQIAASSGEELMHNKYDFTHVESTVHAAARAYAEAGIKNPREELGMLEVHDCFSITEMVTYEDLGISPRGRAKDDIDAGFYDLTGQIPCQPDGGLKCFGHPVAATGLRMMYEMYKQLQGKAGKRQIKNPKFGLTHNMGGIPPRNVVSIMIVGR